MSMRDIHIVCHERTDELSLNILDHNSPFQKKQTFYRDTKVKLDNKVMLDHEVHRYVSYNVQIILLYVPIVSISVALIILAVLGGAWSTRR